MTHLGYWQTEICSFCQAVRGRLPLQRHLNMSFRRAFLLAAGWWLAAGPVLWAQTTNGLRAAEPLRVQLAARLADPRFSAAEWGVKIVSLDSGRTVFEHHADRLMSPASNAKLYVAALALDRLGGNYRLPSSVYATGAVRGGNVLQGDLVVVGRGDPSWNERRLGNDYWTIFEPFVSLVDGAGIRRIEGDVVGDATYFRGPATGSSWSVEDLPEGEVGLISALSLNDNRVRVRVEPAMQIGLACNYALPQPGSGLVVSNQTVTVGAGQPAHLEYYQPFGAEAVYLRGQLPVGGAAENLEVTAPQPAAWFASGLKLALARRGIEVTGAARGVAWPQTGPGEAAAVSGLKLGAVRSAPLRDLVRDMIKNSENLETDLLLAHLGELYRATNAPPRRTSEESGLAELTRFLRQAGVASGEVAFDEGSGLSRNNLTTANATVTLLAFMDRHREREAFVAALPVAGEDGTLSRRFRGTAAAGKVRAKTGTLRWAQALSGYVTTGAGERLAFSFMLNRYQAGAGRSGQDELDSLVLLLANFTGRLDAER